MERVKYWRGDLWTSSKEGDICGGDGYQNSTMLVNYYKYSFISGDTDQRLAHINLFYLIIVVYDLNYYNFICTSNNYSLNMSLTLELLRVEEHANNHICFILILRT